MCRQGWCSVEQGETLGGAEGGLAGGADKLGDVSALEYGDVNKLEGRRDELGEISRHFLLLVIPLLVLEFQDEQK